MESSHFFCFVNYHVQMIDRFQAMKRNDPVSFLKNVMLMMTADEWNLSSPRLSIFFLREGGGVDDQIVFIIFCSIQQKIKSKRYFWTKKDEADQREIINKKRSIKRSSSLRVHNFSSLPHPRKKKKKKWRHHRSKKGGPFESRQVYSRRGGGGG